MKVLYKNPAARQEPFIRLDNRETNLAGENDTFTASFSTDSKLTLYSSLKSLVQGRTFNASLTQSCGKLVLQVNAQDEITAFTLEQLSTEVTDFRNLLVSLGYIVRRGRIPNGSFSLAYLHYNMVQAQWSLGVIPAGFAATTLLVDISGDALPTVALRCGKGTLPSLANCFGQVLFNELKLLLPVNVNGQSVSFTDRFGNSQLTEVSLQVSEEDDAFVIYAGGTFLGIEGSFSLSRIALLGDNAILLNIKATKPQPVSIEDVVNKLFGISLDQGVSYYLPKMKFALHELSFEQIEGQFYLEGSMHQGVVASGETGYQVKGSVGVDWKNGWAFELVLDAMEHPITLQKLGGDLPLAWDALRSFLPTTIMDKIGATTFYHAALSVNVQQEAFSFQGMSNLFGVFFTDASIAYSRARGLTLRAVIDYEPLSISQLLDLLGVVTDKSKLPLQGLALSLTEIRFSQAEKSIYLACRIKTLGGEAEASLALSFDDGFHLRVEYHSEKGKVITIQDAVASTLPEEWARLLPQPGEKEGFVSRFNSSSLSDLYLDVDTRDKQLLFGAAGNFMGLEGSVALSVLSILNEEFINLNITGSEKNAMSITQLLRDYLRVKISGDIEGFIPTMKFVLLELKFDSADKSFYLKGAVSQGEKSTAKYKVTTELGVEWQDGLILDMGLDASDAPLTLAALMQDLPFSLEPVTKIFSSSTIERMGATAFHSLYLRVDTSTSSVQLEGSVNLFGKMLATGSFGYSKDKGLTVQMNVYHDPIPLKQLPVVVGLISENETPGWLGNMPQIALRLDEFNLDQQQKLFALQGTVAIGEAAAQTGVKLLTGNEGRIIHLFFRQNEKPVSLVNLFNKVMPTSVHLPTLPANLDLTLNTFEVYINTTQTSLYGKAEATLHLLDTALIVSAESNATAQPWAFSVKTPSKDEIKLIALITKLLNLEKISFPFELPEVKVKVNACSFSTAGSFTLDAVSDVTVPIPIGDEALEAKLSVKLRKDSANMPVKGTLGGVVKHKNITFDLGLDLRENTTFTASAKNIELSQVVKDLTGAALPEGVPAITIHELFLSVDSTKKIQIKAEIQGEWKFPFGQANLHVDKANFTFERSANGNIDCFLNVKGSGKLSDDIQIEEFDFTFTHKDHKWHLSGHTRSIVFEKKFALTASYAVDTVSQNQFFQLEWKSDAQPLIEVKDVFSLNVTQLRIAVKRGTQQQWAFSATSDFKLFDPNTTAPKGIFFELKQGTLSLGSDAKKTELKFTAPEATIKPLMLLGNAIPQAARDNIVLGLEELRLARTGNDWSFGIASYLALTQPQGAAPDAFFDVVNTLFGKPVPERKIKSTIGYASKEGVTILIENDFGLVIPDLVKLIELDGKPLAEVGESYLCLSKFEISTKPKTALKLTLGLGLPSRLNQVLFKQGSAFSGLFNTYNPDKPAATNIELTLGLNLNNMEFSGSIEKFDILNKDVIDKVVQQLGVNFSKGYKDEGPYIDIDFDYLLDNEFEKKIAKNKEVRGSSRTELQIINEVRTYGGIRIKKPQLSLSVKNKAFRAAGGFSMIGDKLMIPFLPLRKLLLLMQLPEVAKFVPQGIPVRSIDFFPVLPGETERKLNLGDLENYLRSLLPEAMANAFALPRPFKQVFEGQIGSIANRLPERFKEYLGIHLPQNFNFEVNVAPGMGVNVVAEVEKPAGAGNDFKDYLQLLVPGQPGFLYGIRLRKFGLGTALANQALRLDLSTEVDTFDLVTLASSLILPDKDTQTDQTLKILLPNRKKFRQKFEVKDLILFIVRVQAGPVPVPVPIPVYLSKLNLQYFSLEGTEAEFLAELHANLDFAALMKDLAALPGFFTKTDQYLTVDPYPLTPKRTEPTGDSGNTQDGTNPNGLALTVSPFYLQLPGFMGYETRNNNPAWHNILIGTKDSFTISLLDVVKLSMNTAKGMILEKVKKYKPEAVTHPVLINRKRPLNYFIEYLPLKHRLAIKKIKLFFLFDMHLAWAYATPDEFADVVYPRMLEAYGNATDERGKKLPVPQQASPANYLLDLLVKEDDIALPPGEDQGVVVFLRGGLDIASQLVLEGAIGLSVSERKGLRTGIALKGKLFDWIETESLFFVKFNPNSQKEFIKVLGSTFLKVFDREVLKGQIEVGTGGMKFLGMVDAFPAGFPIQIKGFASGEISKEVFNVQAAAGLQLGQFRAALAASILINKSVQEFKIAMAFANAGFNLELNRNTSGNISQISAQFDANVFNLLRLEGGLQLKREPQRLSMAGYTRLSMPAASLLHLEMAFAGEINTEQGFIGFSARLSENAYILSPHCRPSGGVAFNAWFAGAYAGDFVLSAGGYHPAFAIPAHYPQVPRLAINWQIDKHTGITGEAYFALTPNMVMAGAKLAWVYQKDNLRLWFVADGHFLCQWKPLYYETTIGISVGASYTLHFVGWSKTLNVSVDATLSLWGPPTGALVEIKLPIVTIKIAVGEPKQLPAPLANWNAFKNAFLSDEILRINPDSGIIKKVGAAWLVRPDELSFTITTAVPVSDTLNVKPLHWKQVKSTLYIALKKGDQVITLTPEFLTGNVPGALWGDPDGSQPLDASKTLVKDVVTGIKIPVLRPKGTVAFQVPAKNLAFKDITRHNLPATYSGKVGMKMKDTTSIDELQQVIRSARVQRDAVFEELNQQLGLTYPAGYGLQNLNLDNITKTMRLEWRDCPAVVES